MGYHVSIIRTHKGQSNPILKVEVEELVNSNPNFQIQESAVGDFDLIFLKEGNETTRLTFQNGELWTKNPEDEDILVLLEISDKLGKCSRVRGDELETYRTLTETYAHPDDQLEYQKTVVENVWVAKKHRIGKIVYFVVMWGVCIVIGYFLTRK